MRASWFRFAVIFSVPFGLMGSFLFAKIFGLENNIYLQTGVIMLIGLLAKTAILITGTPSNAAAKEWVSSNRLIQPHRFVCVLS